MPKLIYKLQILTVMVLTIGQTPKAQISISGQDCVASGGSLGYLYSVTGRLSNEDDISWQVTGGKVVRNNTSSIAGTIGTIGKDIRIIWAPGQSKGTIKINSRNKGSAELEIQIINLNNAISFSGKSVTKGAIVKLSGTQLRVGDCNLLYEFWWEKGPTDIGPFVQINGSSNFSLEDFPINEKTYFRRVFSVNGDLFYSNTIMVNVQ